MTTVEVPKVFEAQSRTVVTFSLVPSWLNLGIQSLKSLVIQLASEYANGDPDTAVIS